jgi:hypothetical protein
MAAICASAMLIGLPARFWDTTRAAYSAAAASSNATPRNGVQPVDDTLQRLGSHKLRDDVRVQNGHRVLLKFSRASRFFRSLCDLELYAPGRQEPLVNCGSQSTAFCPGLLHRLGEDPTCLFLHRTVVPRCPKPQAGLYAIIKISNRNRRHDFCDSNDCALHLTCQTDHPGPPGRDDASNGKELVSDGAAGQGAVGSTCRPALRASSACLESKVMNSAGSSWRAKATWRISRVRHPIEGV